VRNYAETLGASCLTVMVWRLSPTGRSLVCRRPGGKQKPESLIAWHHFQNGLGNAAIGQLLSKARMVVAATDRGTGGDLLAGRLEDLARRHGSSFERRQPAAKDWNEQLVGGRQGDPPRQDEGAEAL
jgi:hypothetical protein